MPINWPLWPTVDFIKAKRWAQIHFTLCAKLCETFLGVKVWPIVQELGVEHKWVYEIHPWSLAPVLTP